MTSNDWWIYRGNGQQRHEPLKLPIAPKWRRFQGISFERQLPPEQDPERGANYRPDDQERALVNAALFLRRPILVTGKPGVGKSTLAYSVAYELKLGPVLRWPITTRTTLQDGLYRYDALARLQEASLKGQAPNIGRFIRLGPLGTAILPSTQPRVLLIDEIDKSDIDLPNDLLNIFEEGEFEIPELSRLVYEQDESYGSSEIEVFPYDGDDLVPLQTGRVQCQEFPLVILTSNGEREFPPAFLRRCLRLTIQSPGEMKLAEIVAARLALNEEQKEKADELIRRFVVRRDTGDQQELATDQLLNAIHMVIQGVNPLDRDDLLDLILKPLNATDNNDAL